MNTKIKICGLKRPEDIEYVNRYKPDYAGFVFYPPSLRYVNLEKAKELSSSLSEDIIPVGVFLENTLEEILKVAESGAVKILQIHGRNSSELVKELKKKSPLPVWEAFQVKDEEDINRAKKSQGDMILLDNGLGGTGKNFDWSLLKNVGRDFFLAGGLNASNIKEALMVNPYGVDTSSGVETDKLKDPLKIKQFIENVKNIDM